MYSHQTNASQSCHRLRTDSPLPEHISHPNPRALLRLRPLACPERQRLRRCGMTVSVMLIAVRSIRFLRIPVVIIARRTLSTQSIVSSI